MEHLGILGSMVKNKYGYFSDTQLEKYKEKLHKKLFWLLLYQDPKTKDKYSSVDFDKYIIGIMYELNGLNELLFYPTELVSIMSILEAALHEVKKENYDYQIYRKLVLDAHSLIDRLHNGGDKHES